MKELKLEIKILEINVIDDYHEIHYKYRFNGGKWQSDMLEGDYDNGLSERMWCRELEKGVAMESIIQKIGEEFQSDDLQTKNKPNE